MARLDDELADKSTVLVAARAEGRSAPLLLEHVDRALILVEDERDAAHFPARPGLEVRRVVRQAGKIPPAELAWLGRHLSGTKLGLALGAGGAKGFAHVGALQVLEEAGYTVDYVSGSSIGAIVGAYLALGMDAAQIDRTLRESYTPETVAEVFKLSLGGGS